MKKQTSLVEKAKAIKATNNWGRATDDEIELSLAWAKGEVSMTQCSKVLGTSGSRLYGKLAMGLREYIRNQK